MTTKLDIGKIAQLLTHSSRQLDENTLSALANARQNALQRQTQYAPAYALSAGHWTAHILPHSTQGWVAAVLLAAALAVGTGFWQHTQEQQISEIDIAMLTDDLPIEIFIY